MGVHSREHKTKKEVAAGRLRNAKNSLAEQRRALVKAKALLIELRDERIPGLVLKIAETEKRLDYNQREWDRLYTGEYETKKDRIARIRDSITKLESELKTLAVGETDAAERKKRKRKKK